MVTQEQVSGKINDLKGRIEREWGKITNDEWKECEGSMDQLIGLIQQRTGEAREQIEKTMRAWGSEGERLLSNASEAAQEYGRRAAATAREQYGNAQQMVRRHPAESVLVSFGTGLLLGVVLGLVSRSR